MIVHHQHQMYRHDSAMGSAAGVCRADAPAADYTQDWPRDATRAGFSPSQLCLGLHRSRRLSLVNFAGLSRCNGIRPADRYGSRNHLFRHVAELLCHSKISVSCAANKAHEALNEVPEIRVFGTPDDC